MSVITQSFKLIRNNKRQVSHTIEKNDLEGDYHHNGCFTIGVAAIEKCEFTTLRVWWYLKKIASS